MAKQKGRTNWMKDRRTKFVISQEKEEWRTVNKGLSQGGVLSLILYAIYTNDIHCEVDYKCPMLQYADDIAIYSTGVDKDSSIKEVEIAVKVIDENLIRIGLQLQLEKTQLVDFNRAGQIDEEVKIKLRDHWIRGKEKGIVFDNRLKFAEQIEEVKGKVCKTVSILKYLNRVSWGMELNTVVMIYKSYVRSVMEYGIFV